MIEKRYFYLALFVIVVLLIALFCPDRPECNNVDKTIYDIKEQQREVTVEAERIGTATESAADTISGADTAISSSQGKAATISKGITECQNIIDECQSITEENRRIFTIVESRNGITKAGK